MSGTRKKVLWVDDEIEFLRAHIMFLETRGYSVVPVFSGDDAIHHVRQNPGGFDIVLLDEQMPGKDGLTTLEELKELAPDLPVVMVTKSEEERVMEDALGKKIDGYLTKPVNPSQILAVCKRMIDSKQIISTQLRQKFVRSYSECRTALAGSLDASGWVRIYESLVKWDLELEEVEDEGLRQAQAGQKSDANAIFANFVMEHYAEWVRETGGRPTFSIDVVEKVLYPRVKEGRKTYFVVLDCMRLDQYLAIESLLRTYYSIDRRYYYSILPSSKAFARNALFGGMYPSEIAAKYPDDWKNLDDGSASLNKHERRLLADKLRSLGAKLKVDPPYISVGASAEFQKLQASLAEVKDAKLVSIVVEFMDLLTHSRSTSSMLKEIAPDESAYRSLTKSWFQYSTLYQVLRDLSQQDCTVILTTDHGSVFCPRATEVFGVKGLSKNMRYKFGSSVTCDERHALFLSDPIAFRLPSTPRHSTCIIARENYFFADPDKFENYRRQYQNTFQHGGISMEEMIVPLAILEPKKTML
jgi:CheY-like chemotaxis protein